MNRWLVAAALLLLPVAGAAADDADPRLGTGLRFRSRDGAVRLRLGGSLMLDAASVDGEARAADREVDIRRARLAAAVDIAQHWHVRLSYELAGRAPGWRSAWLGWEGGRRRFRLGQFQQPFGLDELTGSSDLTFVERALPNVFAPSYRLGGEARWSSRAGSLAGAVFRGDLDRPDEDRLGLAARWTRSVAFGEGGRLHLGLAGQYREPADRTLRLRSRPEASLAPVLVDTGRIRAAKSLTGADFELALQVGRFFLQSEVVAARVARDDGRSAARLGGAYVAASWRLAGERRSYRRGSGSFGAVRGSGRAWGWELAARWSALDLDDGAVHGGELADWTLGLSGAWRDWGRVLLDVVHAERRRVGHRDTLDSVVLQLQIRL